MGRYEPPQNQGEIKVESQAQALETVVEGTVEAAVESKQIQHRVDLGMLKASTPLNFVENSAAVATELKKMIEAQGLSINIKGRNFVKCEGWTTLAAMLGALPREVETTREGKAFISTVEFVRISDGLVLTRASAQCGGDEKLWDDRGDFARRSMSQTRATSKAARLAFSWVMVLAGYEPTPAEEMIAEEDRNRRVQSTSLATKESVVAVVDEPIHRLIRELKPRGITLAKLSVFLGSISKTKTAPDLESLSNSQVDYIITRLNDVPK